MVAADPVRGLAKDAAFDLEGFRTRLKLRADFEGKHPAPAEKYFDLSFHRRAIAGLRIWRRTGAYWVMGKKPRVTFKLERVAEGDWQIQAIHPEEEVRYIKGFKTKAEVDEWLNGTRRIDWLRSQGYAK